MTDRDVLFAVDFGMELGRADWWNLKKEHTPFQWHLQKVTEHFRPFTSRRADLRAAHMTANLMVQLSGRKDVSPQEFAEMVHNLSHYLRDENDFEDMADLDAVELVKQRLGS